MQNTFLHTFELFCPVNVRHFYMTHPHHLFSQSVSESDIDWLLCVELNTSPSFREFVLGKIFQNVEPLNHVRAWRSVSDSLGESDLVWHLDHPTEGNHLILIENKIKAAAQPEQFERYAARAKQYQDKGHAAKTVLLLTAPEKYKSFDSGKYGVRITYESIIEWLKPQSDERSRYILELYEAAVSKHANSTPEENVEMAIFRQKIWELAAREFPDLNVPDPEAIIGNEYWIFIRQPAHTIIYKTYKKGFKFTASVVDLELTGKAEELESLRATYLSALDSAGITVEKTGKSASLRISVPCIHPPTFDEDSVRQALGAARKLNNWWNEQMGKREDA